LIIHGILTAHDTFDCLIDTMNEITKEQPNKEPKKINWKKTEVFDNSNRGLSILEKEEDEKKKLRKIASKITKVPKSINVPSEYLTGEKI